MKVVEDDDQLRENGGQKAKRYFLYVLDPEQEMEKTLPFTFLTENFLFYFFDQDDQSLEKGMQLLTEVLREEVAKDAALFQLFRGGDIGDEAKLRQQLIDFVGELAEEEGEEQAEEEIEHSAEFAQSEVETHSKTLTHLVTGVLTGDQWMDRICAAIKRNFSNYSKL